MSFSLSIHLLDDPPRAGARTLPVVVGVHSTEEVVLAGNVEVTGLILDPTDCGWSMEAPWRPSGNLIFLREGKVLYLVSDLLDGLRRWSHEPSDGDRLKLVWDDVDELLPVGRFTLRASVFAYVGTYQGAFGDPDEEPEWKPQEVRAAREIVIE